MLASLQGDNASELKMGLKARMDDLGAHLTREERQQVRASLLQSRLY